MRFAYRSRPGIPSPYRIGPAMAAGVIALMGFYGFATSMQKAATKRGTATYAPARNDARVAIAVGQTPSLVYAVTEGAPTEVAAAPPAPVQASRPAPPQIDSEPVEVNLASQPRTQTSIETIEVVTNGPLALPPPVTAPDAAGQAADASARQPMAAAAPATSPLPAVAAMGAETAVTP